MCRLTALVQGRPTKRQQSGSISSANWHLVSNNRQSANKQHRRRLLAGCSATKDRQLKAYTTDSTHSPLNVIRAIGNAVRPLGKSFYIYKELFNTYNVLIKLAKFVMKWLLSTQPHLNCVAMDKSLRLTFWPTLYNANLNDHTPSKVTYSSQLDNIAVTLQYPVIS